MKKITFLALALSPLILMADMDRCVSCHGVDFEKKALGVSKVVKNMSEAEIKAALDGYKKGKGGAMKALMMQEVNLGVDTNAMAADVYNEARTPGFDEPDDDFIFQKRLSVRTLHKIKTDIKNANPKKDMKKIATQIKAAAFTMYIYDDLLKEKIDFKKSKPSKEKLDLKKIFKIVSNVKSCVDHSFSKEDIVKCRVEFVNLATTITKNEEKRMKMKQKANKLPIYTGTDAVDLTPYLKHK